MTAHPLPSVSLKERSRLPEIPAIYFVMDPHGDVVYIGRAVNLRVRWTQHHKWKDLKQISGMRIAWLECGVEAMPEIEARCIRAFMPILNREQIPLGCSSNGYDRALQEIRQSSQLADGLRRAELLATVPALAQEHSKAIHSGTKLVAFRGGALLPRIKERDPQAFSQVAKRDLERYYDLLRASLPDFTPRQASLLVDSLRGSLPGGFDSWIEWLHYTVNAAIEDGPEDLLAKWEADWAALEFKLTHLTNAQAMAVVDAAERFWKGGPADETTLDGLVRVGLVRGTAQP